MRKERKKWGKEAKKYSKDAKFMSNGHIREKFLFVQWPGYLQNKNINVSKSKYTVLVLIARSPFG